MNNIFEKVWLGFLLFMFIFAMIGLPYLYGKNAKKNGIRQEQEFFECVEKIEDTKWCFDKFISKK